MPVKPLQFTDLDRVMVIQKNAYTQPQLQEDIDSFRSKMQLFPEGALGYFVDGELAGYLFCHPWQLESVVPISAVLSQLPGSPDCLYLHDLAVHADYRGYGIGKALIDHAVTLGMSLHLTTFELVAVQGAEKFWHTIGFQLVENFEYVDDVPAVKMMMALEPV